MFNWLFNNGIFNKRVFYAKCDNWEATDLAYCLYNNKVASKIMYCETTGESWLQIRGSRKCEKVLKRLGINYISMIEM